MKTMLVMALLVAARTPHNAIVHLHDYRFFPSTITVQAGTTVQFVNDDVDAHSATANDKSFDSGALDTHETWKHRFIRPGTFAYFCALHPYMKGRIIVTSIKS